MSVRKIIIFAIGTKNVARELRKIAEGRVKDQNLTWFPELADKSMTIHPFILPIVTIVIPAY